MNPGRIACKLVRYSGLPFLLREVVFRRATRIIVFHDPTVGSFERALAYLSSRYNIITLEDHLSGRPLPPKPLVITFDDGHIRNHALLPVFRKAGIRPTFFLCAGLVGTRRRFWFLHAAEHGGSERLKVLTDEERLRALAITGFTPERAYDQPQALQFEHLEALAGQVDFQAHGVFHSCLPNCPDDTAREEVVGAKERLEEMLGTPVRAFAFPNGDYSDRDIALVKRAGYVCALTVDYGFNRKSTDPFRIKRLCVDDTGNTDALSAKVSGAWALLTAVLANRRLSGFKERPPTTKGTAVAAQLAEMP